MKKLSIALLIFSAVASSVSSYAQTTTDNTTTMGERKGRPNVPGTFLIELGWNVLQDAPESMDMSIIGSRTLNMYYFYDVRLGNSKFYVLPGFGVGLDRYKFDNDNSTINQFENNNGQIVSRIQDAFAATDSVDVKKSMLITNYFDIPLEFRFYANPDDRKRSFKAGIGAKFGMRFSSHSKLKFEQDGENIKVKDKSSFELNRFRYGVTGRVGVGGFNVFYYQSLSELFDGRSPTGTEDTSNITIGLSFTGF
ncbi:hypothetical protein E1176_02805 [Fulvivirga sp. RKSG066]|uniref:outer membrane beta-barrel protein n=1 Tax=Fulvivirga aurantia TaxID=2529383 RepID=UPI0012BBD1D3|nr:outer membrane beta-barrel protein [Fulvivirga aurantia]MTI19941.1 hypothetical protein [Fulvivirga aurantia]